MIRDTQPKCCDLNDLVFFDRFIMMCFITKVTPNHYNDLVYVELSYVQTYWKHLNVQQTRVTKYFEFIKGEWNSAAKNI